MGRALLLIIGAVGMFCLDARAVSGPPDSAGEQGSSYRTVWQGSNAYLVVEALDDDLLHFEAGAGSAPGGSPGIHRSPMIANQSYPGPREYATDKDGVTVAELRADIDTNTMCVTLRDRVRAFEIGRFCARDLAADWKNLEMHLPGTRHIYGLGQYFHDPAGDDGNWIGKVWDPLHDAYGNMLRGFAGGANDFSIFPVMYALGEGLQSFGVFLDQPWKQMWDFRSTPYRTGMWGDRIRWLVMAGPDVRDIRRDYMELTGRPAVPPRRAFGLWVSEFGFENWGEVYRELDAMRAAGIPLDGFCLDLQWFGGTFGDPDNSRMGSLTWDERKFPDPATHIRRLRDEYGVRLMLIEEPYISSRLTEHRELASRNHLVLDCAGCGPTFLSYNPWWGYGGMVDFTKPEASDFWHDYRRQLLYDMGIRDHWLDLGEPEQFHAWAWYHGYPELGMHQHKDVHNIYNFRWIEGIARGYQRNQNSDRPFILSRSGAPGVQRFGAAMWSGDIGTNWVNLEAQTHVQQHMSLSGIDYYGSDAGGFQRPGPTIEGGSEALYSRWYAHSSLFDVPLRPHSWNLDKRRPTSPARRGHRDSNLENTLLRYQLRPYLYALAFRAWQNGDPVFPPAFFADPADIRLRTAPKLKMIGDQLLAVTAPEYSSVVKDVYLPRGQWYSYQDHEVFTGGRSVDGYPLFRGDVLGLPLFARAGAIVPVEHFAVPAAGKLAEVTGNLRLKVFPGTSPTSFTYFEDDGLSTGYQHGRYAATEIRQQQAGNTVDVEIGGRRGQYPGMALVRNVEVEIILAGRALRSIAVQGVDVPECSESERSGSTACYALTPNRSVVVHAGDHPVTDTVRIQASAEPEAQTAGWATFICDGGTTVPGVSVYVTGSTAALGQWDPARAVKLYPNAYPRWSAVIRDLPQGDYEWKCLKREESTARVTAWQPGANNRIAVGAGFSGAVSGRF